MKRTITLTIIMIITLCGCKNNSMETQFVEKPESTIPQVTTSFMDIAQPSTTEEIESASPIINEEYIISLFQSILLNEKKTRFDDWTDYGYFYIKDWRDDYYAFSMVDFNHDGQNEICLYSQLNDGQGLDIISYKDGETVLFGVDAYCKTMYSDGYIGYYKSNKWLRYSLGEFMEEDLLNRGNGYYNGVEISKEELEVRKKYYSTTYATKYELTKENVMQHVVLEAAPVNSFPGNKKPENVDCTELSAIQQVLLNQKEYIDENGKSMRVENLNNFYSDGNIKGATFFTVWDINKDGNDEVIVKLEGREISHIIFTEKSGTVYGKEVSLEEFSAIFTDGTYNYNHDGVITRVEMIAEDASYVQKEISAYENVGLGITEYHIYKYGIMWDDQTRADYDEVMANYSKDVVPAHVFTVENVVKVLVN